MSSPFPSSLPPNTVVGNVSPVSAPASAVPISSLITGSLFTPTAPGTVPGSGGGTTLFLRADGTWAAPPGGVGGGSPGGTNGQIQFNNLGAFGGFTVGGDGTLNTATGALIVTKTNGIAFAASATTDTTNAANIASGTLAAARLPNPSATTLGGIQSAAAVANQWINSISTLGVPALSQPAFSNLSGSATVAQLPVMVASGASHAAGIVPDPGVTAGALKMLREDATWVQPSFAGLSGSAAVAQLPVFVASGASHAAGIVPDPGAVAGTLKMLREDATWVQPSFAGLSGSATAAQMPAFTGDVTTSAGATVTTLANIPTAVPMAGSLLATNIAAPATPAAGKTSIYVDSTNKILAAKNDAGTVSSTVVPSTAAANQFATGVSAAGVISYAQPAFSNISGTATTGQLPATVMLTNTTATLTVGYTFTANNLGTIASFTLNPALGNYQYGTNNGAFTLTAPTSDCAVDILVTNGATAGAITFTGFTVGTTGDALTTTNTSKFIISVRRINAISTYAIRALQ